MDSFSNFVQQESVLISICLVVGISLLSLFLIIENKRRKEREARYRCYIEHNSPRYLALLELNKQYDFSLSIADSYTYSIHVKSKKQFEQYNYIRFVEEKIEANPEACFQYIQILTAHQEKYGLYQDALKQLPSPISGENTAELDIPYDFYKKAEADLVSKATLQPCVDQRLICKCTYASPKGRSFMQAKKEFNLDDIKTHYDIVINRIAEKSTKEYQRKAMTNSMRYDIMKRDGFRCVLCGRSSSDGVSLHVDHIVPVAKGGKTVPENLRTLCQECNSGKRDKYDPDGIN